MSAVGLVSIGGPAEGHQIVARLHDKAVWSREAVSGLDLRRKGVQITSNRAMVDHLQTLEQVGVLDGLFSGHDHPDRQVTTETLPIFPQDRTMLGAIEIELKDDPMGVLDKRAALSGENWAQLSMVGSVTYRHVLPDTLEETPIKGFLRAGDVEEDVTLGHTDLLALRLGRLRALSTGPKVTFLDAVAWAIDPCFAAPPSLLTESGPK